jgi:RNA polymerase sigma factor (sigma-70 family)
MPATSLLQFVRAIAGQAEAVSLGDRELLERFSVNRDETAFAALIQRHGPMVLSVCRRVLDNEQDVEDVFQAAFLTLARKARSINKMLGGWQQAVAYHLAVQTRPAGVELCKRERRVPIKAPDEPAAITWWEVRQVLDEELERLPAKYRDAIVLCCLQERTRDEATQQLGIRLGTLKSRLENGRQILRRRLLRRGLTLSTALVGTVLSQGASAAVPLSRATVMARAAGQFVVNPGAAAKVLFSAKVIALTEGVLQSMLLTKVKIAMASVLVLGIAVLGAGGLITRTLATEPAADTAAMQEQGQTNPADLHERVVALKQQLQQLQNKVARLELETQAARKKCDTTFLADRFKYQVPFEIGLTQTNDGGRIEILEVWGTRPQIEEGGQYLVRGKYRLPKGERAATIYFYATAGGVWGAITTTLDLQSTTVDKQEGEFALVHGMSGPGSFHLVLADPDRYSRPFANVYFGTGDNVYRRNP